MKTLARLAMLGLLAAVWPAMADDATKANPGSIWGAGLDEPGCSFIEGINGNAPGRTCRQDCCAAHDKCFDQNHCTAASWKPTIEDFLLLGGGPWLGYSNSITLSMMLNPPAQAKIGDATPGSGDDTLECRGCNNDVAACWTKATVGAGCPNLCPDGKEACYDRSCPSGRNYYCSTDCYNPYNDVCEQEYGDARCGAAQTLGYGTGGTRFGMHGGAFLTCVAWCYNNAAASHQLTNPALTLCAGNDNYEEDNPKAAAGGWISSIAGGSLCCYCGASGLPWKDPRWPVSLGSYTPYDGHNGKEGGHGAIAGCPSGCPCPQGAPCYNINGCWNDSHMCAQAACGEAIGMCCG